QLPSESSVAPNLGNLPALANAYEPHLDFEIGAAAYARFFIAMNRTLAPFVVVRQLDHAGKVLTQITLDHLVLHAVTGVDTGLPPPWITGPWAHDVRAVS